VGFGISLRVLSNTQRNEEFENTGGMENFHVCFGIPYVFYSTHREMKNFPEISFSSSV
jgi:hypothetical protein